MSRDPDLISIGMPAYNGEKYIRFALRSILAQTYRNFELIISDDCSSDETAAICKSFAKKDRRIRYIRQKRRLGFLKNFNFVLGQAKGSYFLWAGNDDYWHKDYIRKLYQVFLTFPKSVLAVSKFNNVHNNKPYNYLKNQQVKNGLDRVDYLIHFLRSRNLSYFYGLHRTENLRSVGGYLADSRPFFHSSDFLTIYKVLLRGPMSYVNTVLFYKRDTGHYTNQFSLIKSLNFNRVVVTKILRFLCFPVFYLYDLYYSIKFTTNSNLIFKNKCRLYAAIIFNYFKYNAEYLIKIVKGIAFVLIGLINKLIFSYAKS